MAGGPEWVDDRRIVQVGPDPLDREANEVKHPLEHVCGFQTAGVTLASGHAAVDGDVDLHPGRAGREHPTWGDVLGLGGLEQAPGLLLGEDQGRPHAVDFDRWCAGGLQHGSAPGSAGGSLLTIGGRPLRV